ncbi:DNA polymerase beta superfamily protein [Mucilaginibacter psychrotolerans]|uniref:Nucleotidyltransferase n=1 Tax=Mucilaginibacter psychrotolerans TaxID=1524096 RepID=A0A4Y8SIL9_9SPHI|nr:nucleotidyltransferase domain-containing protein [Mucilaginibacter psychrotolerans]TFF38913.1 nucleotidyltransferase [Mucilaginibacter psychrotolerans]
MTFEGLKQQPGFLLLDCVSGSHAYNLAIETSDIDKKGIFILPRRELYGFGNTEQVANATNDEVYFEIARFLDLLTKNNPNILELLSTPPTHVLYRNPLMNFVRAEDFLSKLCLDTFAGYAQTQIKKAKGLNKKINKSIEAERKSVLAFCYVVRGNGSLPITEWLAENKFSQQDCGLTTLPHFRDVYLLYHRTQLNGEGKFYGIISGPHAEDVQLAHVPKGIEPLAVMNFNKDGYSVYCREYREYKEWEEKRNDARYKSTVSHGQNYDAKNMMHTFRLLHMADEIALHREVNVHRPDRNFLLKIRNGEYSFEQLMQMVEEKTEEIKVNYSKSSLPEKPDAAKAENILVEIREQFYSGQ